jgi:hypothetical protein
VRESADAVHLTITAPPEAQGGVDELFAHFRRLIAIVAARPLALPSCSRSRSKTVWRLRTSPTAVAAGRMPVLHP